MARLALDLGRSEYAIYERAKAIGLRIGIPQGCESITAAADRCGIERKRFKAILRWAGVTYTRVFTRPVRGKRRAYSVYFVDSFDAEVAVEKWVSSETIESAARSRGMVAASLIRRLRMMGIERPASCVGRGNQWRLPTDTIDDALTAWASKYEWLGDAARRVGVSTTTLKNWLCHAGIATRERTTFVERAVVDAAVAKWRN